MSANLGVKRDLVPPNPAKTEIAFFMGPVLMHLAQAYPDLMKFLLEVIQNAIDSFKGLEAQEYKRIDVRLNLQKRLLVVSDNGSGASHAKFAEALTHIGKTMKDQDELGQFGLGLISPLGKCGEFTFTSCPQHEWIPNPTLKELERLPKYRRWTFITADIKDARDIDGIPHTDLADLVFHPDPESAQRKRGFTFVWWRTQVRVIGISKDARIARFDYEELCQAILARFRLPLQKRGIVIKVVFTDTEGRTHCGRDIVASDFHGRKLDEITLQNPAAGNVLFKLHIAQKTARGRQGKILFGVAGNDFRLPQTEFLKSVVGLLDSSVKDALELGLFEGEIVTQKLTLHPSRMHFVEDDALLGLCVVLAEWYSNVGSKFVEELDLSGREARWQAVGLEAIRIAEQLLEHEQFGSVLRPLITGGTIGKGHSAVRGRQEVQDVVSLAPRGGALGERGDEKEEGAGPTPLPQEGRPTHVPTSVAGPRGSRRRIVKGKMTGLQLQFVDLPISMQVYEFNRQAGILSFNILNPLWGLCEKNKLHLLRYQEAVIRIAFTLCPLEGTLYYEQQKRALLDSLAMEVFVITSTGTIRFPRKK